MNVRELTEMLVILLAIQGCASHSDIGDFERDTLRMERLERTKAYTEACQALGGTVQVTGSNHRSSARRYDARTTPVKDLSCVNITTHP